MGKIGRFGIHGGQYIPEVLMNAVTELEEAYNHYRNAPEFNRELSTLQNPADCRDGGRAARRCDCNGGGAHGA